MKKKKTALHTPEKIDERLKQQQHLKKRKQCIETSLYVRNIYHLRNTHNKPKINKHMQNNVLLLHYAHVNFLVKSTKTVLCI